MSTSSTSPTPQTPLAAGNGPLAYRPVPGRFDEAVAETGGLRTTWASLVAALGNQWPEAFFERQRRADRLLDAEGAGHLVHEMGSPSDARTSLPWRLDPLPVVLDHAEFALLADAATQRMRLFELLLADLAGPRSLVRDGVVPAATLFALPGFRPPPSGVTPRRWLVHYAVDVVRDAAGQWRVVQDLTDAPSGLGYALLDRAVLARVLPDALRRAGVAPIHDHADVLRRALTAAAPSSRRSPRCVVLTSGPSHPSYVEHSYLSTLLGYHLAEGADVVMRQGRMWLRALDGLEPVDIVYRRIDDAALDPLEPHHTGGSSGVPGVVWGAYRDGVTLANGFGSGLAQAPQLRPFLADAASRLLGQPLLLDHLDVGSHPTSRLASTPVFTGRRDDPFAPAAVVLRLHVADGPDGLVVMPGAAGRVLADGDDPCRPTSRLAKDVWVVGSPVSTSRLAVRAMAPQVDFGTSVPTRAADSLYWFGRTAERAEVAARSARTVATRLDQDPLLVTTGDGGWGTGASALLRAAAQLTATGEGASEPMHVRLEDDLRACATATAAQLGSLLEEALSVREYLSATTGRVLGRLAAVRADLRSADPAVDDLDTVLVDLAALAGLAMESTVRGPAWRFADIGRRLERALAVLGSVEATLGLHVESLTFQPLAETVLQANESLVAYRRRYRSDVDLDAVLDLLVRDDTNPRSLAFQLDRLREHVAALAWSHGVDLVQKASLAALATIDHAVAGGRRLSVDGLVLGVRAALLDLGDAIVARWFADPVNPMLVRGR